VLAVGGVDGPDRTGWVWLATLLYSRHCRWSGAPPLIMFRCSSYVWHSNNMCSRVWSSGSHPVLRLVIFPEVSVPGWCMCRVSIKRSECVRDACDPANESAMAYLAHGRLLGYLISSALSFPAMSICAGTHDTPMLGLLRFPQTSVISVRSILVCCQRIV